MWENSMYVSIYLQRRCMVSSDQETKSVSYFRSNCIRKCRLESIIALCNCIPFFYVDIMHTVANSTKVCTLDKVPCLSHYKGIEIFMLIAWINQQVNTMKFNCFFLMGFSIFLFFFLFFSHCLLKWHTIFVYKISFYCVHLNHMYTLYSEMANTIVSTWKRCRCWNRIWEWFNLLTLSTVLFSNSIFNINDQITITSITEPSTQLFGSIVSS